MLQAEARNTHFVLNAATGCTCRKWGIKGIITLYVSLSSFSTGIPSVNPSLLPLYTVQRAVYAQTPSYLFFVCSYRLREL